MSMPSTKTTWSSSAIDKLGLSGTAQRRTSTRGNHEHLDTCWKEPIKRFGLWLANLGESPEKGDFVLDWKL